MNMPSLKFLDVPTYGLSQYGFQALGDCGPHSDIQFFFVGVPVFSTKFATWPYSCAV